LSTPVESRIKENNPFESLNDSLKADGKKKVFGRPTGPVNHLNTIINFNFLKLIEEFTIHFARSPNRYFTIVNSLCVVKTLGKHG
jgi:hypothetical protein